jgi:hypothetical protein
MVNVAKRVGHASIATTYKMYAHISDAEGDAIAAAACERMLVA